MANQKKDYQTDCWIQRITNLLFTSVNSRYDKPLLRAYTQEVLVVLTAWTNIIEPSCPGAHFPNQN